VERQWPPDRPLLPALNTKSLHYLLRQLTDILTSSRRSIRFYVTLLPLRRHLRTIFRIIILHTVVLSCHMTNLTVLAHKTLPLSLFIFKNILVTGGVINKEWLRLVARRHDCVLHTLFRMCTFKLKQDLPSFVQLTGENTVSTWTSFVKRLVSRFLDLEILNRLH
jgi:hypothetical protein